MIDCEKNRSEFDARVADESKAIGHVLNPGPVPTKTKFFAIKNDETNASCYMVLCRVLGSAMWLRYPKYLIDFKII